MVDIYLLSVIIFFGILGILIYRDRNNIEFKYILITKKTKTGMKFINNLAKLSPTFWKIFSTIGIFAAILVMIFAIYGFILNGYMVVQKKVQIPALQFIFPLPQPQPVTGPGYILIPFWFWIIVLPFILLPHELMHGVIARVEKIRITSVGLFILAIFPGGFVEPDEKMMKKSGVMSRLRIISVGSFANFIAVLALFLLAQYILWPTFVSDGVVITSVNKTESIGLAGIKEDMVLQEMGGKKIKTGFDDFETIYGLLLFKSRNVTEENVKSFVSSLSVIRYLKDYKPGDSVIVKVDDKFYDIKLGSNPDDPEMAYMGINSTIKVNGNGFSVLFPLIWWCYILGLAVAILNILPIYPLDGGLIVDSLAEKVTKKQKTRKRIVLTITFITISLLAFNFAGPLFI